jgi:hypothetical protein
VEPHDKERPTFTPADSVTAAAELFLDTNLGQYALFRYAMEKSSAYFRRVSPLFHEWEKQLSKSMRHPNGGVFTEIRN